MPEYALKLRRGPLSAVPTLAAGEFAASNDAVRLLFGSGSTNHVVGVKHNISASTNPGTGDDSADGYSPGSLWVNTTADTAYVCLDATAGAAVWQVIGSVSSVPAATVPRGHIDGLVLAFSSGSVINVAAGQCADSTGAYLLSLSSTVSKTLQTSGSWAAGSGSNGLDTGSRALNTWYHVHLIAKADGTSADVLISTSASAPTMPSTYTLRRRIGSVRTDGTNNVVMFYQRGDNFLWSAPQDDVSALNPGTAAVTRTLSTPSGVRTLALVSVGFDATATGDNPSAIYLSDLDQANSSPSVTVNTYVCYSTSAHIANTIGRAEVWTNTSSQIRSRLQLSATNTRLRIQTHGWRDPRGRDNL